jgi:thioredoxin-related protein
MSSVVNLFLVIVVIALINTGGKDKSPSDAPNAPASTGSVEKDNPAAAGHDIWMTDYQAAMKKATDENKDLLIDFSGSDWCGWCIKLDKEVFAHKEFIDEASKDFVFVMLDFPKKKQLAPELTAQNDELWEKYKPRGYPTVFLTDAKGDVYAETSYIKGGPKAYLAHLAELRKNK